MNLRQRVEQQIASSKEQAAIQRDQDWAAWTQQPASILAILECPHLAVPPSQRDGFDIIKIALWRCRSGAEVV